MNLALKDILHAPPRFLVTIAGVAFLITAAIGMIGLYRGIVSDALLIVDVVGADLWVVQGGRAGPFSERSSVPMTLERRVAGVAGVATTRRFMQTSEQFTARGASRRAAVTGVDLSADDGRWIPLVRGRMIRKGHYEAVVDRAVGVGVGETIPLAGDDYAVVGITRDMVDISGDGMMFVSINDAMTIAVDRVAAEVRLARRAGEADPDLKVAAVLTTLQPGADAAAVAAAIAEWGDVNVLTAADQRELLLGQRLWRLRVQILAFTSVLLMVTAIVVSLIVYTMTLEKLHTIAMLKLMGARGRLIAVMIGEQAALIGLLGFALGLALAHVIFPLFPRRVLIEPGDNAMLFGVVAVIVFASALVGVRRANRVRAQEVLA
ncbi:ABC transporter permease [Acuticoccus sediminis]|uniref:ABC transporter permease n=1 Tax=Acuticoccus sediminis TaxID=2184697 RepID=UPI001CFE317E|nr:ABC transporter permease [Acuticoccus sediminis]